MKKEKNIIKDGASFSKLLANAHVKGLLDEIVLVVKKGVGKIQAIDLTSSLFLSCEEDTGIKEDMKIGINNLPVLIKFFEGTTTVFYELQEKWIILKKGKNQLKCLLSAPNAVSTNVEEELNIKQLKDQCNNSIKLSKECYDELASYVNLITPSSICITSRKNKSVFLTSNEHDEQQIKVYFGKCEKTEESEVEIFTDHFLKVLSLLNWNDDVTLFFGNDCPTVIQQKNSFWALVPLIK